MYKDLPPRYRDILRRYYELIDGYEFFCYSVTTPLTLSEAVRRIGMEEKDLLPSKGHGTLAEHGCLLIGQVGPAVVTFDATGTGRFLRTTDTLAKGCDYGVVQWDDYNLVFDYIGRDGGGGGWDDELEMAESVAALRDGSLAEYADLFARFVEAYEASEEDEVDPVVYLQALMLTVLELETGVRVDDQVIDGLSYALHIPANLR
ncbi:hypothetical protein ACQP25_00385 [Microtetraspora malaysiensis]|uniref:hypothetical protein n=1 Tax=Microtetraspora malaysiensis TaxID=161358 RepID=UPI003D9397DD